MVHGDSVAKLLNKIVEFLFNCGAKQQKQFIQKSLVKQPTESDILTVAYSPCGICTLTTNVFVDMKTFVRRRSSYGLKDDGYLTA